MKKALFRHMAGMVAFAFLLQITGGYLSPVAAQKIIRGKVRKFLSSQRVFVSLSRSKGLKVGSMLYVARNGKRVAVIKVVQAERATLVGWIVSSERGMKIKIGDQVTNEPPPLPEKATPGHKDVFGHVKRFKSAQKITVALERSEGIHLGDTLFVVRDGQKVAEIKVLRYGSNFLFGWIVKTSPGFYVRVGDLVTHKATVAIAKKKEKKKGKPLSKTEIKKKPSKKPEKGKEKEKRKETSLSKKKEGKAVEEKKKQVVEEKTKQEEEKTKGSEKSEIEKILEKLQRKHKEQKEKKEKKEGTRAKPTLAIVNITYEKDKTLASHTLDSLTVYFVEHGEFEIIERARIDKVLTEQGLTATGFVSEASAIELGKLIGANLVVVGSISSISLKGKPKEAYAVLHIRGIESETGKVVFAKDSRGGSGKLEISDNALIQKALDRAAAILVAKVPVPIEKVRLSGYIVVPFGKKDGIQKGNEIPVLRDQKEIGKIKIAIVREKSSEGQFVAGKEGIVAKESDQVENPNVRDDKPPLARRKKPTFIYVGLGLLVVGVAVLLGTKHKSETTPNVPPLPPPGKGIGIRF